MLPDHDVYVADWHKARDVPLDARRFGLDEFIEHIMLCLVRSARGRTSLRSASRAPPRPRRRRTITEDRQTPEPRAAC